MTNILIPFHSRGGATEALALAVAEGVAEAGGEARLRRVRELVSAEVMASAPGWAEAAEAMNARHPAPTIEDAEWADGLVFGSPTRFGSPASELRAWIDGLGGLWFQGKLVGKAGAAFATTSTTHGGNETTILSLYPTMAHLGLVIVPLGYVDPVLFRAATPYGPSAVSANVSAPPTDDDRAAARVLGRRVTQVAAALKPLRG